MYVLQSLFSQEAFLPNRNPTKFYKATAINKKYFLNYGFLGTQPPILQRRLRQLHRKLIIKEEEKRIKL